MAGTSTTAKSNPLAQRHTNGISHSPARDPRPILPPTPSCKKGSYMQEAQKSLKRPRETIELVNRSGRKEIVRLSRIIPVSPKYSNPKRQTRSLDPPPRVQQVQNLPPPRTHKSQPDESRAEEPYEKWSPKRLRSRETRNARLRHYVDSDDSMDDSDEESEEDSVAAGPAEEKEYDVEGIDGERLAPGTHEYWIRWMGYVERTWTPSTDCFCPDLIAEMRAVQGADLDAARSAGREEEVDMLEQLRDTARVEAQNFAGEKPHQAPRSRKTRGGTNDQVQRGRTQSIADSLASSGSRDGNEVKSEYGRPRDARANTAWRRLGSAEREQANATRYVAWFRSKPIDVDALMENDKRASPKTIDIVEAWRAATASDEMGLLGKGRFGETNVLEEGSIHREMDIGMRQADIQRLENDPSLLAANSDSQEESDRKRTCFDAVKVEARSATTIQTPERLNKDSKVIEERKEEDDIANAITRKSAQREAVGKEVQIMRGNRRQEDMVHEDRDDGEPSRARSGTYIKDEQDEANKLRERNLRRRTQQFFDNAATTFAPNIALLRASGSVTQLASDPPTGPVDNAQKLKAAREKEMVDAVKKQNTNMPRLQLDS
ncbi:hypothetical protein BKA65DRAFT_39114 [Rhexocercosporidium sp. MPI-PUGE-AT-0058]|nr:hypothetical protein BKA65DRAFT_39114 [Rhexocercosporidium sp. MPI-PUGE-AT-0058]